ncbi:MAG TPA: hypothetical protein VLW50_10680 [Streptosporangiaceae bacterium]|nr:hypothetical protein [Streptosporangiaceae bacterium]
MAVDQRLDRGKPGRFHRGEVGKVAAQPSGAHEGLLLARVLAKGAAQHGMQNMRSRVRAGDGLPPPHVQCRYR